MYISYALCNHQTGKNQIDFAVKDTIYRPSSVPLSCLVQKERDLQIDGWIKAYQTNLWMDGLMAGWLDGRINDRDWADLCTGREIEVRLWRTQIMGERARTHT